MISYNLPKTDNKIHKSKKAVIKNIIIIPYDLEENSAISLYSKSPVSSYFANKIGERRYGTRLLCLTP